MKKRQIIAVLLIVFFGLGFFNVQGAQAVTNPGIEGSLSPQADLGIGENCFSSDECGGTGAVCHKTDKYCYIPLGEGPQGIGEILKIMGNIGNLLFAIFMGVALLFLVWGGMQFVISGGDPTKVSEAKKRMIWAVIGVSIALLAAFVDDILRNVLGVG
jgi:hypothetical protein